MFKGVYLLDIFNSLLSQLIVHEGYLIMTAGYGVVDLENIEPGIHRLKIMHDKDQCGPRRKIFLHFSIDDGQNV